MVEEQEQTDEQREAAEGAQEGSATGTGDEALSEEEVGPGDALNDDVREGEESPGDEPDPDAAA